MYILFHGCPQLPGPNFSGEGLFHPDPMHPPPLPPRPVDALLAWPCGVARFLHMDTFMTRVCLVCSGGEGGVIILSDLESMQCTPLP